MAGKAILKETIKKKTIADMKSLGVFKAEYEPIITIYCELREQYEKLTKEFVASGYAYSVDTGSGGEKKSPIVATLESLRKDILQYSDRLCLNPKANQEKEKDQPKESALGRALRELESS